MERVYGPPEVGIPRSLRVTVFHAVYNWMLEHKLVPYIFVDTTYPGVELPPVVKTDTNPVVLNIAPSVTEELVILPEHILQFYAYFNKQRQFLSLPLNAIVAIKPKESKHLVPLEPLSVFDLLSHKLCTTRQYVRPPVELRAPPIHGDDIKMFENMPEKPPKSNKRAPFLKLVKNDDQDDNE